MIIDFMMHIRLARTDDSGWIVPLSSRLHDFGPPSWRPRDQMDRAVAEAVIHVLTNPSSSAAVYAAEDEAGRPLGFVHVHTATDYFTQETHGHVSDLAVSAHAEGRGVATALMEAAEAWCRERGLRLLTLNVFGGNHRARALYERLDFRPDTTKYVKVLNPERP